MANEALKEAIAKGEAEGDEAEQDEAEQDAESAPEPEQGDASPVDAPTVAVDEEAFKKADKAIQAQKARLGKILGTEAVAHDCFVCSGIGFLSGLPPVGSTYKTVLEGEDIILVSESGDPDVPLRHAPDKAACQECDGLGQVLSGSRNPHARIVGCSKCQGNGWVTVARDANVSLTDPTLAVAAPVLATNGGEAGIHDAWGRAPGHKYWGVPPAQVPG